MQSRVPDTSKVKNLVGFRITHDTRQIVQSVIDYFSAPVKPRRANKAPASAELQHLNGLNLLNSESAVGDDGCFQFGINTLIFLVPTTSLLLTLACVPAVRRLAVHWGCVALPKKDRWHSRPTPTLGGVAFYAGFVAATLLFSPSFVSALPFLLIVTLMFLVGIYDDLRQLNPATKLIGQIASAAIAIYFGYRLHFFSWAPLDAFLTGYGSSA